MCELHGMSRISRMPPDPSGAMIGRTLLIVIVGHLSRAPRAIKEAAVARAAGARVWVRGTVSEDRLLEEDAQLARELDVDWAAVVDLRPGRGRWQDRARQRRSRALAALHASLGGPRVLGPGAPELLAEARALRADLTMVHSEPGLWVGKRLLGEGLRVGVDFEDWFSRDQLPGDRPAPVRRWLAALERHHLLHAHCTLTTTSVLAAALSRAAGGAPLPTVVPNCPPPWYENQSGPSDAEHVPPGTVSLYWVSQTIGPGRGLEVLARALERLHGPWQLCLRGAVRGHGAWLDATFPTRLRSRIKILEPVPNRELVSRARAHHVGLALEQPYCDNKDLTASNKLFEYLASGLAVMCTATRGQAEILAAAPGAGKSASPGDDEAMANALQAWIDDPGALRAAKTASAAAAAESSGAWHWDRHSSSLLDALVHGVGHVGHIEQRRLSGVAR